MPKITAIQPQKKREGYYNIFIDDVYECSLSDLSLAITSLRVGQELTTKQKSELINNSALDKAYSRALYYLRYGPRTIQQMRQYLVKVGFTLEHIEIVLKKLQDQHYLDDELYALNWVTNRVQYKKRSKRKLHQELLQKGINKEHIQTALQSIDDEQEQHSIKSIITKKAELPRYQDKQKMTQYLLSQGFSYSAIKTVFEDLNQ